ncbi:MAG: hypothetical protein SFW67_17700 [Myxococcaceae bacterium]|nr:hypothetical protein [Myxococcaceae bacterium]
MEGLAHHGADDDLFGVDRSFQMGFHFGSAAVWVLVPIVIVVSLVRSLRRRRDPPRASDPPPSA